jgi:hypothetical protein
MAQFENVDSRGPGKPYSARTIENAEVALPGPALAGMLPELCMIDTLLQGTNALRAAKRDYLPQHEYETNKAYERRVKQSFLDNFTLRTLNTLVGKALKEPPAPSNDMTEKLVEFLDNVDGSGTGLVPFARGYFRDGVKSAVSYLFVDTPVRIEGETATLASQTQPVWRMIPGRDMLDYREGPTAHGIKPTMIRFRDDIIEDDGKFGSRLVERVKVVKGDSWELWELQTGPRGGNPKWVMVQDGALDLGYVTVVPFYTDKTGPGEGRSQLADLAHMNVRHWQSNSDQINILTVVRFPIFAASGVRDDPTPQVEDLTQPQVVVGPNKFLSSPDAQSKFYWVEHTGAAIDSGTKELERLENGMASYGAEFLKKGTQGPETASGRVLDAGEAISPLQSWGLDFKDALMLALTYTAEAMGLKDADVTIDFEVESDVDMADSAELTTLDSTRTRKDISRRAYLEELKRRGVLTDDYDIDADEEEIAGEPPPPGMGLDGMSAGLAGAKPTPKKPPPPKK